MVVDLGSTLHLRSLGRAFCRWCPDDRCSCKCLSCGRLYEAEGGCICPDGPTVRVKWDGGAVPCEGVWGSFFHERAFGVVKCALVELLERELLERKLEEAMPKTAEGRAHLIRRLAEKSARQCSLGGSLAARLDDAECIRRTWLRRKLTGRYKADKPRRTSAL